MGERESTSGGEEREKEREREMSALTERAGHGAVRLWRTLKASSIVPSARSFSSVVPPEERKPTAVLSDIPHGITERKVTIYTPGRSASQQGMGMTTFAKGNAMWRIEFEPESKWENPLMGWTSTADSLENVGRMTMAFDSKESAIRFADKNGWSYKVREPQLSPRIRTKRFNEYGDNFSTKRGGPPVGGFISETIGDKNKGK